MIHLGLIEYLNALPLTLLFEKNMQDINITYGVPSTLNALLRSKKLDCSLISSAEYIDGNYTHLSPYGIYARAKICSVNLYLQKPILDVRLIGLTEQSATSISLLKVLCHHLWKIRPEFVLLDRGRRAPYDGFLLIGDEALEQHTISGYDTIDLASVWYEWTGLPFVFGMFAAHGRLDAQELSNVLSTMQRSLEICQKEPERLIRAAQQKTKLRSETLQNYFSLCHHELDQASLEGLNLFKRLRQDVY